MSSSISLHASVHCAHHFFEYSDVKLMSCVLKCIHKMKWSESFHSLCFFWRKVATWTMWAASRKYISSFAERAQLKYHKALPSLYRRMGSRNPVVSAVSSPIRSTVNSLWGKISKTNQVPVAYEVNLCINASMMDWCSKILFFASRNRAWKWRGEGGYVFTGMDFKTPLARAINAFIL